MQRETERFRIIYPETLSDEAARLASTLDDAVDAASEGLSPPHPPPEMAPGSHRSRGGNQRIRFPGASPKRLVRRPG
jgi:hypothetical protein